MNGVIYYYYYNYYYYAFDVWIYGAEMILFIILNAGSLFSAYRASPVWDSLSVCVIKQSYYYNINTV